MVPVADRPECSVVLDQAFALANALPADVVGYHLRPHREERRVGHGERVSLSLEDDELPELSESQARLNTTQAAALFCAAAEKHGVRMASKPDVGQHPRAFWGEMVGTPGKLFGIIGPTSDLIVISRPKSRGSGPARAFLLAALLRSGKPLLVLPQKPVKHLGRRILVAWDQGVPAASAMTAALPLLAMAREVHLLCCGKENLPGPKTRHARNYLRHWGIEAETHRSRGREPEVELARFAREARADPVVMGAYSRGRLRERILGGMTHQMLLKSDLPVFTLHH